MYSGRSEMNRSPDKEQISSLQISLAEDFYFQAINRYGESIRCEMLFSFSAGGQDYLVYTDNSYTITGRMNVYATLYHPETLASGKPLYLRDPESDEQWRLVYRTAKEVLSQF